MKKYLLWIATFTWALLIFYLTSIPNFKVSEDTLTSLVISNGGHFFFFGVQAVLLSLSLSQSGLTNMLLAIIPVSLYGLFDELHQLVVPGRSADPLDWLLDTLGAITFLAIINKYSKSLGFRN